MVQNDNWLDELLKEECQKTIEPPKSLNKAIIKEYKKRKRKKWILWAYLLPLLYSILFFFIIGASLYYINKIIVTTMVLAAAVYWYLFILAVSITGFIYMEEEKRKEKGVVYEKLCNDQ